MQIAPELENEDALSPRDSSIRRNALACNTARRKNMQSLISPSPSLSSCSFLSLSLSFSLSLSLSLQSYFLRIRAITHMRNCTCTRGERDVHRDTHCATRARHDGEDEEEDDEDGGVSVRVTSRIVENTRAVRFHVASSRATLDTRRLRLELVMAKFVESLMVDLAVDRNRAVTGHGIARLHGSCLGSRMCLGFRSPQFVNPVVLSRRNPERENSTAWLALSPLLGFILNPSAEMRKLVNTLFVGIFINHAKYPGATGIRGEERWEKRDRLPTLSLTPARANGESKQG